MIGIGFCLESGTNLNNWPFMKKLNGVFISVLSSLFEIKSTMIKNNPSSVKKQPLLHKT